MPLKDNSSGTVNITHGPPAPERANAGGFFTLGSGGGFGFGGSSSRRRNRRIRARQLQNKPPKTPMHSAGLKHRPLPSNRRVATQWFTPRRRP
jgi:hypothetical protein